MSNAENTAYAIPLFALIDRSKVDLRQDLPENLAEQLRLWLEQSCSIRSLNARFIKAEQTAFLVLQGVPEDDLPALFALVDVQRSQLFRYERPDEGTVRLTPLNVKVE